MINTRYEIIKKLGEGRSSVYLCHDIESPDRKFAIKILPAGKDKHETQNFIDEFFTLQKLEHPNIIKAYEFGTVFKTDEEEGIQTGSIFITLEFFEGEELLSSKMIRRESILREVIKQISASLYYLHQSKYIYYDLKPENILISLKNNKPQIRLIDLGLSEYSPSSANYEIKGTAHYIAPELLKRENHNHSVDFYSLGMIIYRLIYNQFPFEAKNELNIYKSAIEEDFPFPLVEGFSDDLISVTKKLLEKEPDHRYNSALTIIEDLGFSLNLDITKEFLPARIYSCRDSVINNLSEYIKDNESTEVYTIKGFEGVGKSSLLNKFQEIHTQAIKISEVKAKPVEELILHFLRKIIFSESVYPNLSDEDKLYLFKQLGGSGNEIINEFRNCIAIISSKSKFILLIDDFNLYDQLVSNLLLDIIPLLQVNNTKIVLIESSEHEVISGRVNNLKEISLGAFIGKELKTFLEDSFYSDFPHETIQNLIIKNADLIPGNIKSFIKDLILFGIMKFIPDGLIFQDDENKLSSISEAHFAVYDLRLANLTKREMIASQIISSFEIYIDSSVLSLILGLDKSEIDGMIFNLQFYNIIQKFISGDALIFTSEALKNYIYASIDNKKKLHHNIAVNLSKKLSSFNRIELARQYEFAEEFEKCYTITIEEINDAEKHSAYSYIQKILSHLISLPHRKELLDSTKVKLSEIYLKLGDFQSSLALIKTLKDEIPQTIIDDRLFMIEGSALIASGEFEAGRRVISGLLNKIKDTDEKNRLKVELAYADFELKLYNEATQQCQELLEEKNLSAELKGRCYNLSGMINIYQDNDLKSALENFENAKSQFSEAGQSIRVSGAEVNIGNIYNIFGNHKKAEEHLQNASRINQSVGNLDQEGLLMQNMGIFYFDRRKIDNAIQSYHKAIKIFVSLGNDLNRGLVLWDLGEIHIASCEYNNALESLIEAQHIFQKLNNYVELLDVFFLKAKLFYKIGAFQKFEETFEEFQTYYSDHNLIESHQIYQKLLVQLKSFYMAKTFSVVEIDFIRKEMVRKRDNHNFIDISFFLIQYFINEKWYQKASQELYNQELMDLCSQNSILEAEREYFLGIISKNSKSDKLLSPLIYFEKAYYLIKDQYINELTWKVLFEISELYIERGNLHKAKYFVTYTRELIYFIAEKIESPQLRAAYLRNSERLNTLKKLESFYPSS